MTPSLPIFQLSIARAIGVDDEDDDEFEDEVRCELFNPRRQMQSEEGAVFQH